MITETSRSFTDKNLYDFMGLSTDEKPTLEDHPEMTNGSSFFEMNTKKIYFWDAENEQWV